MSSQVQIPSNDLTMRLDPIVSDVGRWPPTTSVESPWQNRLHAHVATGQIPGDIANLGRRLRQSSRTGPANLSLSRNSSRNRRLFLQPANPLRGSPGPTSPTGTPGRRFADPGGAGRRTARTASPGENAETLPVGQYLECGPAPHLREGAFGLTRAFAGTRYF